MTKTVRPLIVGTAQITAAWIFLAGAIVSGIVGVYRMMTAGASLPGTAAGAAVLAPPGADCMCLGVLLGVIAAVLALIGIHKQVGVVALVSGGSYTGSHGSDDNP